MTTIPVANYERILKYAQDYYEHCAAGDNEAAAKSLSGYFNSSRMMNPSVARMGLQQAQNDVFLRQLEYVLEDKIDIDEYKQRNQNIANASSEVNHDSRLSELEHRIRDFRLNENDKVGYSKSYKKRLALMSCIMDSEKSGIASVKYTRDLNGKIKDTNQIVEKKFLKKIMYAMRKLFTK